MNDPSAEPQRDPELSGNANKYAPPNGLSFDDGVAHLRGYQEFSVEPRRGHLRPIGPPLIAKDEAVARAFTPRWMARRSVLDLGGNNGFFAFRALGAGAAAATVVDIDAQCILNLDRVRSRFPEIRLEAVHENCDRWDRPADVVLAFALVHWIYSCTSRALSLDKVVGHLAALTRELLVIEWVDPTDPLVEGYRHTETPAGTAAEPYDFGAFRRALDARFSQVELLAELSPTRRVYAASRGRVPDLSWSAPLLYPKETLLASRLLWEAGGVEYWSRVYRVDGCVVRQCTPELARRELAGAAALGTPIEVLEQRDGWWALRARFVDGITLDEHVARARPSREEALGVLLDLVGAVEKLSAAGIHHRDVHPLNVILSPDGRAHLIDFGWAQVPGLADVTPDALARDVELFATGKRMTVRPPESAAGDLFAIGRIAEWMVPDDPELSFVARWLAHPDYRQRLVDVEVAREILARLLRPAAGPAPAGAGVEDRMQAGLATLARGALADAHRFRAESSAAATDLAEERRAHRMAREELRSAQEHIHALKREGARASVELAKRDAELERRQHYIGALEQAVKELSDTARRTAAQLAAQPAPSTRAGARPVSIVLPVRDRVAETLSCLEAIVRNTPGELFEIVVVDDASTDETPALLAGLEGDVKVIRNEEPRGLVTACNQGAAVAGGRYLAFLGSDTRAGENWLPPLLQRLERDPTAAVAAGADRVDAAPFIVRADVFRREGGLDAAQPELGSAVAAFVTRAVTAP